MSLLRSLLEAEDTFAKADVISKLTAAEKGNDVRRDTKGFALEDENGNLVRVFVPAEQANDFERVLGQLLDDHKEDDTEIASILFELKSQFDIIDVEWSEGSIPEDEEVDNGVPGEGADQEPVDADVEGPEGENPAGLDGEDGADENPMSASDMDVSGAGSGEDAAMSALDKIIDMMKSDSDARKADAEARKAEAAVQAGKVAAQAAAAKARAEEEIMDMENFNKRKKEEKRQRDLQAKLIRYRHDQQDGALGESAEEKFTPATPEEEELMDMEYEQSKEAEDNADKATRERLNKWRHRKKKEKQEAKKTVNENLFADQYPTATPEEEEMLDMEDWERDEKERKQREATHERLKKYRHARKKQNQEEEEEQVAKKKPSFAEFSAELEANGRKANDEIIDLSHRAQY
jgi:chemotaxis protein histidine kinase CheA